MFKIWILLIFIVTLFFTLTTSCEKAYPPTLTTSEVSNVTLSTASCGGIINGDFGEKITEKGVCWSTSKSPTIADNKTIDGTDDGSFTSALTGLNPSTAYYVSAYATNSAGTGYGKPVLFATQLDSNLTISDIDGNKYHILNIGTRVWTVENLNVSHFQNGDSIPFITDNLIWATLSTGAYSDYDNIPANSITYGRLYNWYCVADARKISPIGWHVASNEDWWALREYMGDSWEAGEKAKESGTNHWVYPNTGADNSIGFTALPGGCHLENGYFNGIGYYGYWWSSLIITWGQDIGMDWQMSYNSIDLIQGESHKRAGLSVRCVKD